MDDLLTMTCPLHIEPDPDVIPDVNLGTAFVQELYQLADEREVFMDFDENGAFRLRTWYIHHRTHPVQHRPRIVEVEEDWRQWEPDILS